jgi:hypothetical protein
MTLAINVSFLLSCDTLAMKINICMNKILLLSTLKSFYPGNATLDVILPGVQDPSEIFLIKTNQRKSLLCVVKYPT